MTMWQSVPLKDPIFCNQRVKMPCGTVRPLKLADVMSERNDVWQHICEENQLKQTTLDNVANWSYADATLERYWDEIRGGPRNSDSVLSWTQT